MRKILSCIAAGIAILSCAGLAEAAGTLVYGFESGADGFAPNGFPGTPTIAQDTIGATQGTHSLKYAVPINGTFVGALSTQVLPPFEIGNPPGIKSILFDLTIPDGGGFTGAFADIGVVVFGSQPADNIFGAQAQFTDLEGLGAKGPGTYLNVQIDLDHAIQFGGQSFNDVFGTVGSPSPKLIPSGFEFFINKSNDAPITVYIDNVRTVVPEPASLSLLGLGAVGIVMFARRRNK